jgi:hypothetical protein
MELRLLIKAVRHFSQGKDLQMFDIDEAYLKFMPTHHHRVPRCTVDRGLRSGFICCGRRHWRDVTHLRSKHTRRRAPAKQVWAQHTDVVPEYATIHRTADQSPVRRLHCVDGHFTDIAMSHMQVWYRLDADLFQSSAVKAIAGENPLAM